MLNASAGRIRKILIFDREQQNRSSFATGDEVYSFLLNFYADFFKKIPAGIPLEVILLYDLQGQGPPPAGLKQVHVIKYSKPDVKILLYCTNPGPGNKENTIPSGWVQDWIIPDRENKWYYSNPENMFPEYLRQYLRLLLGDILFHKLNAQCQGGNILIGEQNGTKYLLAGGYSNTTADNKLDELFNIAPQNVIRINPIIPGLKTENPHLFHLDLFISIIGQVNYPFAGKPDVLLIAKAKGLSPVSDEINRTISHAIRDLKQHPSLNFVLIEIPFILHPYFNLAYNNCHVQNYMDKGLRRISICFPSFIESMLQLANELLDKNDQQQLEAYNTEIIKLLNLYTGNKGAKSLKDIKQKAYNNVQFKKDLLNNIIQLNNTIEAEIRATLNAIGIDSIEFIRAEFDGLAYKRGSLHCMSLAIERE